MYISTYFFRFEDGTLPFLEIVALHHAFNVFEQLIGSMRAVLNHTHSIALYVYNKMSEMTHNSGKPLCKIYSDTDFKDNTRQGPIINFNLLRASGDFVGYSEVRERHIQQPKSLSHNYYFLIIKVTLLCLDKSLSAYCLYSPPHWLCCNFNNVK